MRILTIGTHGIGGYNAGCRCEVCRKAKSIKRLEYQSPEAAQHAKEYMKKFMSTVEYKTRKKEYDKIYNITNKDWLQIRQREYTLRKKYKMTFQDYDDLLELQNGVCAICKQPPNRMPLGVDHDHKCCPGLKSCGKCIRGLLCQSCNSFLGKINENPDTLIEYLVKGGVR